MAQLFPVMNDTGRNRLYCGPRSIATLTGVPVSRIEKMARRIRPDKGKARDGRKIPVRGMYNGEVLKLLKRLGCKVTPMKHVEHTLGRFIEDTKHTSKTYLVNVTYHYIVVHKGQLSDNYTGLRKIVERAWEVEAPEVPKYTTGVQKIERAKKPKPDIKVVRAARVDAQLKAWGTKLKRAKTMVAKLKRKKAYYDKATSTIQQASQG